MGFYEDRRKTADTLIRKYGLAMILRDNEAGEVFDGATGVTTPGTPVDYPVRGILYPITKKKRPGGASEATTDQRAILSAEGIGVEPKTSHQLVVGGIVYEIKSSVPLAPGGLAVIYELTVAH